MSRSYHSNRSWRYWLQAGGLSPEDIENIQAKGEIKRRVRERRVSRRDPAARSPAYGIEITIRDDHPGLLYPTSEGEIRQVLSRIEAPELEGVRSITLGLGMTHQERYVAESNRDGDVDYDPVFNRPGKRMTAGLYFPLVEGTYEAHAAAVELYGYVVTDEFEIDPMGEFALKIHFVRTLLHEMAHHHQYRTAMLHGRVVSQLDERLEVGERVPAVDALGGDDEGVTVGRDRLKEEPGLAAQVTVQEHLAAFVSEDAQVHGARVEVDAAVVSMLASVEAHGSLLGWMKWLRSHRSSQTPGGPGGACMSIKLLLQSDRVFKGVRLRYA